MTPAPAREQAMTGADAAISRPVAVSDQVTTDSQNSESAYVARLREGRG
jgi:hypothetical protein